MRSKIKKIYFINPLPIYFTSRCFFLVKINNAYFTYLWVIISMPQCFFWEILYEFLRLFAERQNDLKKVMKEIETIEDDEENDSKRNRKIPRKFQDVAPSSSNAKVSTCDKKVKVSYIHLNFCFAALLVTNDLQTSNCLIL